MYQTINLDMIIGCDSKMICHSVTNILSNAIKFSPEGSIITVEGFLLDSECMIEIVVQDGDVGIPKDHLESIFSFAIRK